MVCNVAIQSVGGGGARVYRTALNSNDVRIINVTGPISMWSLSDVGNGMVQMIDYAGQCLVETQNPSGDNWLQSQPCTGSPIEKYYLQRESNNSNTFIIRHAFRNNQLTADHRCLDVVGGVNNWNYTQVSKKIQLRDCRTNSDNLSNAQRFNIVTNSTADTARLNSLAASAAGYYCSMNTTNVSGCSYAPTSTTPATLGSYQRVSEYTWNPNPTVNTLSVTWSQNKTYSESFGHSATASMTVGTGVASPYSLSWTMSYTFSYTTSWSTMTSTSSTVTIPIPANSAGWVVRAQIYKTMNGTFTFDNKLGGVWTIDSAQQLPATDGTDNLQSVVVICTKESTAPVCVNTRPI